MAFPAALWKFESDCKMKYVRKVIEQYSRRYRVTWGIKREERGAMLARKGENSRTESERLGAV